MFIEYNIVMTTPETPMQNNTPTESSGIGSTFSNLQSGITGAASNIGSAYQGAKDNVSSGMDKFSSAADVASNDSSFLDANGIVAKFAFLIIVVVVFMVLMNLGIYLIGYFTKPNTSPLIIDGQILGNYSTSAVQNPNDSSSILISRSNNATSGIEFTWSVWLLYNPPTVASSNKYQPVFVKGDAAASVDSQFYSINNGPGVYFGPIDDPSGTNTLYILMDTVASPSTLNANSTEKIIINNIPISKYFHLAIRCQNKYIDVYINGTIVYRNNLTDVPKQNYYNVNVCGGGGFNGYLSNLQYFTRSLTVTDINSIVGKGPNTKNAMSDNNFTSYYLSNLWYNAFLK